MYGKLKENGEIELGTVYTLLKGVSNPSALSLSELNARQIYKVVDDDTKPEKWQVIKSYDYVFELGEIIRVKNIEDIPLEDFKASKNKEIKNTLFEIMEEGFTDSTGVKIDIKEQDRANWMSNLELMSLAGQTETEIRDFNNVTHILTFDEYKSLVIEAGAYIQQQFQNKWKLNQLVKEALTHQDVDDIYWRKANYDENDEFVDYTYNGVL